jgi:uncharacterized protein YndB with AHSA1/START domain
VNFSETFEIHESAEAVFDALLDEKRLRSWLAEHVRVEAHKGGVFEFWGNDVIWCQSEKATRGEILELDRPRTLAFSWRWKGHHSRVLFGVSEAGDGCRLTVEHSFETIDAGPDGPGPDMAGCHWRIAIGNLTSVLASGRAALRPDYRTGDRGTGSDALDAPRVELEIEIAATPAQVFRALLDPAQVKIWMQIDAPRIDPNTSEYSYGWERGNPPVPNGPSRIVELIPDRLLVHDWHWTNETDGQVRWELTVCDTGTRLCLTHTNTKDLSNRLGWSDALIAIRQLFDGSASST